MTWEIPWAITGVDEIPLSTARLLVYVASQGESGVVLADDLKISATSTPSNQIQTASGAFVVVSGFLDSLSEAYAGRNTGTVLTNVPNTSGVSRYDFVYAHITDPGKAGQPPTAAAVETRVITGVSSTAATMDDVPSLAGQAGLPLARIFRGASATIVNSGDITDLRKVAMPKSSTITRNVTTSASESISSGTAATKPSAASWSVDVPAWATSVVVNLAWQANSSTGDPDYASPFEINVKIGTTTSITTTGSPIARRGVQSQQTIAIPAALRGTSTTMVVQGRRVSGSDTFSFVSTVVSVGLTFQNQTA